MPRSQNNCTLPFDTSCDTISPLLLVRTKPRTVLIKMADGDGCQLWKESEDELENCTESARGFRLFY